MTRRPSSPWDGVTPCKVGKYTRNKYPLSLRGCSLNGENARSSVFSQYVVVFQRSTKKQQDGPATAIRDLAAGYTRAPWRRGLNKRWRWLVYIPRWWLVFCIRCRLVYGSGGGGLHSGWCPNPYRSNIPPRTIFLEELWKRGYHREDNILKNPWGL